MAHNSTAPRAAGRWDQRYAVDDYVFSMEPHAFLAAQAHRLKPGMRALAVVDGEGRNCVWLARQRLDLATVNASAVGLEKARNLAVTRGVQLTTVLTDIGGIDWEQKQSDVVVAIFMRFVDPALRARMFAGMQQPLRRWGLLRLQDYRPERPAYGVGGLPAAENLYTAELLRSMVPAMQIESLHEHDSDVTEDHGHWGTSTLIDLVVRRC